MHKAGENKNPADADRCPSVSEELSTVEQDRNRPIIREAHLHRSLKDARIDLHAE
jgi:hypothetical protein